MSDFILVHLVDGGTRLVPTRLINCIAQPVTGATVMKLDTSRSYLEVFEIQETPLNIYDQINRGWKV